MTLQEYQTKILELDSDIANLQSDKTKLLYEGCKKHFPQFKKGTLVKFSDGSIIKYGRIKFSYLNNNNPFRVKIIVKPCKMNGEPINRVVLHAVIISDKDVLEIIK